MQRKIIKINSDLCNGCGACAAACHEGAIAMIDGKAVLTRDDYCDGLGDCLPACPANAISFEVREAAAYDETAVLANKAQKAAPQPEVLPCGCPGSNSKAIHHTGTAPQPASVTAPVTSQLSQWPVQIKLAPVNAPYFENASLLIAADCTAYAYGNFHREFIKDRITLIGCPKLDSTDYSEKLTEILARNSIKNITVVRMEVPCCGGIEQAIITALKNCQKMIPWQVVTISTEGMILK